MTVLERPEAQPPAMSKRERLARLLDFYRKTHAAQGTGQGLDADFTTARVAIDNIAEHLLELAEDVRLDGIVIVLDHGDEIQKRCLGL
jgi:hypothetical protein